MIVRIQIFRNTPSEPALAEHIFPALTVSTVSLSERAGGIREGCNVLMGYTFTPDVKDDYAQPGRYTHEDVIVAANAAGLPCPCLVCTALRASGVKL